MNRTASSKLPRRALLWVRFAISLTVPLFIFLAGGSIAAGQANELSGLIETCQPRMATIYGAGAGRIEGYASGIVVSADGMILTTQGVFLDGQQVKVELRDGKSYPATIVRRDRTLQLALLKIEADKPLEHFELFDAPVGTKGDWVVALSNAFKVASKSEPLSAMIGIISLRTSMEARLNDRDVAYDGPLVLIDAITSNPGASGGAVVTFEGKLVGMIGKLINSSDTNTRLNYCVPSSTLKKFVAGETSTGSDADRANSEQAVPAKQGELGIVLFKLGGRNDPAYIDRVRRRSPAAKLKLKPDDLILSLAGEQIGSVSVYQKVVKRLVPDEPITIVVKRGSEVLSLQITPTEKKSK